MRLSIGWLGGFAALASSACFGQQWELGGAGGYGFSLNNTVSRASLEGKTGFRGGIVVSAVAGQHPHRYLSGEFRYTYRNSGLKLTSGGTKAEFSGDAHIVHYDVLIHSAPRGSRIRPFVAFGGGIKQYRGTGQEKVSQPLDRLAILTHTRELKPLVSVGGGVSARIANRAVIRIDVRDYITPFPSKVIAPAPGAAISGWVHDFAPMVGISAIF